MLNMAATSTNGTSYTAAQVQQILLGGAQESWRFDRLDASGKWLADITRYVDFVDNPAQVENDTTRSVMRTLSMSVQGNTPFNPLHDLIRPWYQVTAPDGGLLRWPLGLFTLLPITRTIDPGYTWQALTGADLTQLLADSAFQQSYSVSSGTNYLTAISTVIAQYTGATKIQVAIPDPGKALPSDLTWDAGTSYLQVIQDLLTAVNYYQPWCDEWGVLRSSPIPDYSTINPGYVFDTTKGASLVLNQITEDPDWSSIYNQFLVKVENTSTASSTSGGTGPTAALSSALSSGNSYSSISIGTTPYALNASDSLTITDPSGLITESVTNTNAENAGFSGSLAVSTFTATYGFPQGSSISNAYWSDIASALASTVSVPTTSTGTSGTVYAVILVGSLPQAVNSGDVLVLIDTVNNHGQQFLIASDSASAGSTAIPTNTYTAAFNIVPNQTLKASSWATQSSNTPVYAYYENKSSSSPISLVNWHPRLNTVSDSTITDQATAYARAVFEAQKSAMAYGQSSISTMPWPFSQSYDVYGLWFQAADEGLQQANYFEQGWLHRCQTGQPTDHTFQRIYPGV